MLLCWARQFFVEGDSQAFRVLDYSQFRQRSLVQSFLTNQRAKNIDSVPVGAVFENPF
jgi:hypothetical protein